MCELWNVYALAFIPLAPLCLLKKIRARCFVFAFFIMRIFLFSFYRKQHTRCFFCLSGCFIYQTLQCKRTDKSEKLSLVVEVLLRNKIHMHSTHWILFTTTASCTTLSCFSFHLDEASDFFLFFPFYSILVSFWIFRASICTSFFTYYWWRKRVLLCDVHL